VKAKVSPVRLKSIAKLSRWACVDWANLVSPTRPAAVSTLRYFWTSAYDDSG